MIYDFQVPKPRFAQCVSPWHYWFAWYPIYTWDHRWIWVRTVKRRLCQPHWYLHEVPDSWFQYHYDKGYVE